MKRHTLKLLRFGMVSTLFFALNGCGQIENDAIVYDATTPTVEVATIDKSDISSKVEPNSEIENEINEMLNSIEDDALVTAPLSQVEVTTIVPTISNQPITTVQPTPQITQKPTATPQTITIISTPIIDKPLTVTPIMVTPTATPKPSTVTPIAVTPSTTSTPTPKPSTVTPIITTTTPTPTIATTITTKPTNTQSPLGVTPVIVTPKITPTPVVVTAAPTNQSTKQYSYQTNDNLGILSNVKTNSFDIILDDLSSQNLAWTINSDSVFAISTTNLSDGKIKYTISFDYFNGKKNIQITPKTTENHEWGAGYGFGTTKYIEVGISNYVVTYTTNGMCAGTPAPQKPN